MLPKLTFVLGGACSGKSLWAENLIIRSQLDPVYLATSRIFDNEMQEKINRHKARRSGSWLDIEADCDLAGPLVSLRHTQAVLIDCATMWLTNLMMDDDDIPKAQSGLLAAIGCCRAPVVIVSNEVGQGIVPDNALARRFREAQGHLNCALAAQSDLAVFVVAGLPQVLKGALP
jgi:adenosylcobinamide kinase/adenosylcobinamide-phosphate guanylyltransferase